MAKAKKAKPAPRNKKLYDAGMKMRKEVLGAQYVDNSMAGAANDEFMMAFQDITTEYTFPPSAALPQLPAEAQE